MEWIGSTMLIIKLPFSAIKMVKVMNIVVVAIIALVVGNDVSAQNCGCESGLCCSQYGYCGRGDAYCGSGCKEGNCYTAQTPPTSIISNVSVADIVTPEFFNSIIDRADTSCAGKNFYSRAAFLDALSSYPQFGITNSVNESKREIAAAFAHFTHETGYFCYIEEIDGASKDYCDKNSTQYPCTPKKGYYGRGPIQLSWNFNYGPAGESIGFDGLNAPEIVANNVVVSFKTALWYWMQHVRPVINQGFGATIRAINGRLECDGASPNIVLIRVNYYTQYCSLLGVAPGDNLTC